MKVCKSGQWWHIECKVWQGIVIKKHMMIWTSLNIIISCVWAAWLGLVLQEVIKFSTRINIQPIRNNFSILVNCSYWFLGLENEIYKCTKHQISVSVKQRLWTADWRLLTLTIDQALVFPKVDNTIQQINHYPADNVVYFVNTYLLDSNVSGGQR